MQKTSIYCVAAAVATGALAACAQSPESIAPAYVSPVTYENWSCDQLGEESSRLSSALASAGQVQQQARTQDTVGIILIGLPLSSMSGGNIAPQIARLKGEYEAVRQSSIRKNCGHDIPQVEFYEAPDREETEEQRVDNF